jgi:hypothetical protein
MDTKTKLHSIVLLIVFALVSMHAQSQCLYEYYGKAGDSLYIGEDSDRPKPDEPPPYVYWIDAIARDSTDGEGGRYWWFEGASDDSYYKQYPNGSVEYFWKGVSSEFRYGMCDEPGQLRKTSEAMLFLGYDVIYLFRKPAWAMRYARYRVYGDSLVYTEYDYFVVPGFGEVLELETHHGIGKRRLVGAVVNGVRYGCAATTTSVDDEQLGPTSLRVEGSSIHIGGEIPPGSVVQVFDLHGRLQRQVQVNPYDAIHLDDLPRGVYFATVVDARGASPRLPLRIVIR